MPSGWAQEASVRRLLAWGTGWRVMQEGTQGSAWDLGGQDPGHSILCSKSCLTHMLGQLWTAPCGTLPTPSWISSASRFSTPLTFLSSQTDTLEIPDAPLVSCPPPCVGSSFPCMNTVSTVLGGRALPSFLFIHPVKLRHPSKRHPHFLPWAFPGPHAPLTSLRSHRWLVMEVLTLGSLHWVEGTLGHGRVWRRLEVWEEWDTTRDWGRNMRRNRQKGVGVRHVLSMGLGMAGGSGNKR